jgi:hypothetical protein
VARQEAWAQTAPPLAPPPPEATLADCTGYTNGGTIEPAPRGYDITITSAEVHDNLDFGFAFRPEPTALDDVQLWLGLKSSDDQGTQFDVKVELLKNGYPVASGLRRCVTGLTRNPRLAKGIRVAWDKFTSVSLAPSDVLALKISTRIGTNPDDKLWPGAASAHTSAGIAALLRWRPSALRAILAPGSNHRFTSTRTVRHARRGARGECHGEPDRHGPTARAKCKDSSDIKFAGGNRFSEVGTGFCRKLTRPGRQRGRVALSRPRAVLGQLAKVAAKLSPPGS